MEWSLFRKFLLLVMAAMLFTSCFESADSESESEDEESLAYQEEKGVRDEIRNRVTELKAEKKALEERLSKLGKSAGKEDEIREEEVKVSTELEAARAYAGGLATLEAGLDGALGVWREATRNSFKGVKLPEIVTVSGTRYGDVTLKEVGNDTVVILHTGGEATLNIVDLPVGLRKNLIHESTVLTETEL